MRTIGIIIRMFVVLFGGLAGLAHADSPTEAPRESPSAIGYRTVAAALEDLRSKAGVEITVQGGWTIASDRANLALWSFAPAGHAAYPSVVKRTPVKTDGGVEMKMDVLCEASKPACDQLVADFVALNDRMRQSMKKRD